jgi:hypothetical protein
MIEEVAQGVKHLRLFEPQGLRNVDDRFATLVQRYHVADGDTQTVDHRLAATDPGYLHDMRMLSFYRFGHRLPSGTVGPSSRSNGYSRFSGVAVA